MTGCWRRASPRVSAPGCCRGYRYLSCPQCQHRPDATPTTGDWIERGGPSVGRLFLFAMSRAKKSISIKRIPAKDLDAGSPRAAFGQSRSLSSMRLAGTADGPDGQLVPNIKPDRAPG